MIDINFLRNNPDKVKENIKKKFQDHKLHLVDDVIEMDVKVRALKKEGDDLRAKRNTLSTEIGMLMKQKRVDEANKIKAEVVANNERISSIEKEVSELDANIKRDMMSIPNIIADDVPIGPDDKFNVQAQTFLEHKVPEFEVPYHTEILE